ncbi:hypothetical protein EV667_3535 [Ancylobacter aquaticus]|uniref:DUF1223 domain-containing protein n=1 Tax=Ancylobacter aquaticus TaxID=100 RepID=A0A4R1HMG9_ANCAQ|nr:DUF1223 domain-containing protein [Ancylobacter aquaticus]TCK23694.1 hypothetical protein EV667_3535 [Ancylobacter aquaticus]
MSVTAFALHLPVPRVRAAALALLAFTLALPGAARAEDVSVPAVKAAPVKPVTAPKAVIELFTSQGCSSCPPADKLMGELAARSDVIALTLAVDYWDYLGWKDTLAKHGHSLRQKAYAHMRGDGKMFTPQAVVNGRAMMIGSDQAALERTLASTTPPPVPVSVESSGRTVKVRIGAVPGAAKGEVWLCPVASRMDVEIGRGENEGAKVVYHNVVRGWVRLGTWEGTEASFEVPVHRQPGDSVDAVAVFVQSGSSTEPGTILGAALHPLD